MRQWTMGTESSALSFGFRFFAEIVNTAGFSGEFRSTYTCFGEETSVGDEEIGATDTR